MAVLVDVWSDIACPWCYVGKTRFDLAIQNIKAEGGENIKVTVNWHPYMIDQNTKLSGEEFLAYNKRRWGSAAWTSSLRRSGARDGLAFINWKWWPNTLRAHRLVLLAETEGKAAEAVQLLFQMTYEDGQNISDLEVLYSAAQKLNLPNACDYLASDQGEKEVLEEDRVAKDKYGINSVPYFLLNRRRALSGAQETSTIEHAIRNEWLLANKE